MAGWYKLWLTMTNQELVVQAPLVRGIQPNTLSSNGLGPAALGRKLGVTRQRADQLMNAEKHRARKAVSYAVRHGNLVQPDCCERCGEAAERIEGHHDDYSKPLDVRWFCPPCHSVIHPHIANRGARLRWPCPSCGGEIDIKASGLPKKMPAHCRPCAAKYCLRGHLKKRGVCRDCRRDYKNVVIEYRPCADCGTQRPITRNYRDVARRAGWPGTRCRPCNIKHVHAIYVNGAGRVVA